MASALARTPNPTPIAATTTTTTTTTGVKRCHIFALAGPGLNYQDDASELLALEDFHIWAHFSARVCVAGATTAPVLQPYLDIVINALDDLILYRSWECLPCGAPATAMRHTFGHMKVFPNYAVIMDLVTPLCERDGACETMTVCNFGTDPAGVVDTIMRLAPKEKTACEVCLTQWGVKRCSRCKAVRYCSAFHQQQDWMFHKDVCTPRPAGSNP